MKKVKMLVSVLTLSMIGSNPIIAKADEIEKKTDLTIDIETSKESYSKEEDIGLNLNFINNSEYNLKDIDIVGTNIGDKYVLKGNTKINLNVGEEKKIENVKLTYIKVQDSVVTPGTGDESGFMAVGVVAIGSALCLALARKNKKGIVATIVIGTIITTGLASSNLIAYAETKQETVVVTKEVVVDGKPMKVELIIGYEREEKVASGDSEEVIITPASEIETVQELAEKREALIRDYLGGKISKDVYQYNLDKYYERRTELYAAQELAGLPKTEDGRIDLDKVNLNSVKYESTFNAYKEELTKCFDNGEITEEEYNEKINMIDEMLQKLKEKQSQIDQSELQKQEEEAIKYKIEQEQESKEESQETPWEYSDSTHRHKTMYDGTYISEELVTIGNYSAWGYFDDEAASAMNDAVNYSLSQIDGWSPFNVSDSYYEDAKLNAFAYAIKGNSSQAYHHNTGGLPNVSDNKKYITLSDGYNEDNYIGCFVYDACGSDSNYIYGKFWSSHFGTYYASGNF